MSDDLIREALEAAAGHSRDCPRLLSLLADALERAEKELAERHPPRYPNEGWDSDWIRLKTQAAITHLRDLEDWAISQFGGREDGESDASFKARVENASAMILARRARECYEHIAADIKNGKTSEPSMRERLERVEKERDEARRLRARWYTFWLEAIRERDRLSAENERLREALGELRRLALLCDALRGEEA